MAGPHFDQVNVVVRDMGATLAFYRKLGFDVPDDGQEWPPGSGAKHVEVAFPSGVRLEFDNLPMAKIWHAGWRAKGHGSKTVIGVSLSSREAVDERYAALTAAGYTGCQPPYDAFFGARYAVVEDPDGNDVGLMSPIDPAAKFVPEL
ncbi:MAG TPA: VOC family protein [Candidatus Elarobacter sp.]|jgi:catechol 2,3-dioxygenase-like lactoylglutathione lyase family enzyme